MYVLTCVDVELERLDGLGARSGLDRVQLDLRLHVLGECLEVPCHGSGVRGGRESRQKAQGPKWLVHE